MATIPSDTAIADRFEPRRLHRIGVARLAAATALAAAGIFLLCWLGTFIPLSSPTHAYPALFTQAAMGSTRALVEAVSWSFLFGGLSGGLIALVYNLLGKLAPR